MDNTSSGSTSASQERMPPESKDPYDMKPLKYSSRSSNYTLMNIKELDPRGHMRSEYFSSQDEIEDAAILAVKRQLGRDYRKNGPSIGVKFESLPPSAFDAPIEDTVNGPCYLGDSIVPKSVGVLKVHKEPTSVKGNTKFSPVMRPRSSYSSGDVKQIRLEPDHQNDFVSYQSLGKSSHTNCRSYGPGLYSSEENINSDPAGVAGFLNKSVKHGRSPLHGLEEMRQKSIRNNSVRPYDKKVITSGSSYPRLHNRDGSSSHMLQKGRPSMIPQYDEHLGTEHRELSRTARLDEGSLYRERKKSKENANSVRGKMQLNNERRRKKKRSDEYLPLDYSSKTPSPHVLLPWENQMKGHAGEIPTSFSDDETVGTSSSID